MTGRVSVFIYMHGNRPDQLSNFQRRVVRQPPWISAEINPLFEWSRISRVELALDYR